MRSEEKRWAKLLVALACVMVAVQLVFALGAHPILAATPRTPADAQAEAEVYASSAKAAFAAKQFEKSAELFMKAYAKSAEPSLLFNAARAYQEAGKPESAIPLFRLYLQVVDKGKDPDGFADAVLHLRTLEAAVAARPVPPGAKSSPSPRIESVESVSSGDPVKASAGESRPRHSRTLAWTVTGLAGATVATGIGLMLAAKAESSAANRMSLDDLAAADAYEQRFDDAESLWKAGAITIGGGAVLAGLATWLHIRHGVSAHAVVDPRGRLLIAWRF